MEEMRGISGGAVTKVWPGRRRREELGRPKRIVGRDVMILRDVDLGSSLWEDLKLAVVIEGLREMVERGGLYTSASRS